MIMVERFISGRGLRMASIGALAVVAVIVAGGCSAASDRSPLPSSNGVIDVDNPIVREQVVEVTKAGKRLAGKILAMLEGSGANRRSDWSHEGWGTCTAHQQLSPDFLVNSPQNGIRYEATFSFAPVANVEAASRMLDDLDVVWSVKHHTARSQVGVFTVDLDWSSESLMLNVYSPCYFVRKVGKNSMVNYKDIDALGGFTLRDWE